MQNLINLLARALFMSTPLILGALGEVIAERTGMMMCAVEGVFLAGAWGGFVGAYLTGSIAAGFLTAILCGMLVAMLYGFCTIYLEQHQIVMGTAVAILMTGFCTFFYRVIFGTPTSPLKITPLRVIRIPLLSRIPFIGPILFSQNLVTYITVLLVPAVFFLIYRTAAGLTLRSCGENPAGCLGGVAGAYYSLCNVGMYNSEIISGRGWIAFGICFLGNWNPAGALLFGIVFGISDAIGTYIKALGASGLPSELFSALPYFLVIVLTALKKQFNVPAQLGTTFRKEE